jgi:hypothetical protein
MFKNPNMHAHTHTFDLSRGDYEIIVKALPSLALIPQI